MASIITDNEQLNALGKVNAYLDELKILNTLLKTEKGFRIASPLIKKESIEIDSSLNARVVSILKVQKDKISREIQKLTLKYKIALDRSDLELMETQQSAADPGDADMFP